MNRPSQLRRARERRRLRPNGHFALEERCLLANFTVTHTGDSGPGSLRQAILDANATPGPDNIFFDMEASTAADPDIALPGFDVGNQTWTITLNSALPAITDTVTIDGYSQAHFPKTFVYGAVNEVQEVAISGAPTGSGTFRLQYHYYSSGGSGAPLEATTAPISRSATAAEIQAALEALSLRDDQTLVGNVRATGGPLPNHSVQIEFINDLRGTSLPGMFATDQTPIDTESTVRVGTVRDGSTPDPMSIVSTANTTAALSGNNAVVRVIINGANTNGATGFTIQAPNTIIRGLGIDGFGVGVSVPVPPAGEPVNAYRGALIQGNAIGGYLVYPVDTTTGISRTGTAAVQLVTLGNTLQGVRLGSTNAIVGGAAAQDANVIIHSGQQGVSVLPGAEGNVISGNQIGVVGPSTNGRYFIGAATRNGAEGVLVASASNTIGGAAGNLISGNLGDGIRITSASATQNRVEGNYIGVAPGGGFLFGSGDPGNLGDGIRIENAPDNRIGGPSATQRNVIAANDGAGVRVTGASAINNVLQGNLIGLTANGVGALGNAMEGVVIDTSLTTVGPDNVISSNLRGVLLIGPGATGNVIQDNSIGTDIGAGFDLGNALEGIRIENAPGNTVRGTTLGAQVISGNDQGIVIVGASATGNLIQSNHIGADATGAIAIANSQQGILIDGAGANTAIGNRVLGNHWGIELRNAGATANVLQGNTITQSELDGVLVQLNASNNLIGGANATDGNTIFLNSANGIRIVSGTGNAILSNSIFNNGGLGIRLDPGANHNQPAPTLTRVQSDSSQTEVTGTVTAPPNTLVSVQIFANTASSSRDEGQFLIGSLSVRADAAGQGGFDVALPIGLATNVTVTAIATVLDALADPTDSSSFSAPFQVQALPNTSTFVVTNTNDSGPGSLRQAILDANENDGRDSIEFDVPASTAPGLNVPVNGFDPASQTWTITLRTPLPAITDAVTIDGNSQGQFPIPFQYPAATGLASISSSVNTTAAIDGNNAVLRLILDGHLIDSNSADNSGFTIQADHTIVRGLVITGFQTGVTVSVPTGGLPRNAYDGVLIQGNYIGGYFLRFVNTSTGDPLTGGGLAFTGAGNRGAGVVLGSTNAIVGGAGPQESNVITKNGLQAVSVLAGAEGNVIAGNQIGIAGPDAGGRFAFGPNGTAPGNVDKSAILIASASNTIGGAAGNLISGNRSHGAHIIGPGATRNRVEANYIGVGPGGGYLFGTGDPGNLGDGVWIDGAPDNQIGGPSPAQRNIISANERVGVRVTGDAARNNTIQGNYVGLTSDGGAALGNSLEGIFISAPSNIVGPGNVISANLRGVVLTAGARDARIVDNFIGTDAKAAFDLGNSKEGIRVENIGGAVILGTAAGAQVISGNDQGIVLIGPGASGTTIANSYIGADATGAIAIANSLQGILIDGGPNNVVGGTGNNAGNLILGNHWGIELRGAGATGNLIQGNTITRGEREGVLIVGASNNTIGGVAATAGNTISLNSTDGIHVVSGDGIVILSNAIFDNGGLGIRLDPGANRDQAAPTITDADSFSNSTIVAGTMAGAAGQSFRVQFFSNATADPTGFGEGQALIGAATVTIAADGQVSFKVTITTSVPEGSFITATATLLDGTVPPPRPVESSAFSNALIVVSLSTIVTTTEDNGSNASPLPGSLRAAIMNANDHEGLDIITFAIPSEAPGFDSSTLTWRLLIVNDLPALTDNTIIDGYSQRATAIVNGVTVVVTATPNTSDTGENAKLRIILDGGDAISTGLVVQQQSTIRGLVFDRFSESAVRVERVDKVSDEGVEEELDGSGSVIQGNFFGRHVLYKIEPFLNLTTPVPSGKGNSGVGIELAGVTDVTIGGTDIATRNAFAGNGGDGVHIGPGADRTVVQGNLFGLLLDGTTTLAVSPNGAAGVRAESAGNLIGGTAAGARNVFAANRVGIHIAGPTATGNLIQGNFIGTGLSGLSSFGGDQTGNTFAGIQIENAPGNVVGGPSDEAGNLISGNTQGDGVLITGAGATNNLLIGNRIGVDLAGAVFGNRNGVHVANGASNNRIGGLGSNDGNLIAHNDDPPAGPGTGVWVESGTGNAILSNAIANNTGPGIRISPGANHDQPAPVIESVGSDNTSTIISGALAAAPDTLYVLQFFASPVGTPLDGVEGQDLIGSTTVRTGADGVGTFSLSLLVGLSLGQYVTATATALQASSQPGDSSAFSFPTVVGPILAAGTIIVTNANDSGPGSFRQAILDANAKAPRASRIAFFIPEPGRQTILLETPLPTITSTVYIDGNSQRGGSLNTVAFQLDAPNSAPNMVLLVEIRGILLPRDQPGQNGLVFDPPAGRTTANSVVAGLMISDFPGSGIVLEDHTPAATGSLGVSVLGNIIQNNGTGITIHSSNNQVGGPLATGLPANADRNLIQGNRVGALIETPADAPSYDRATGNRIENNYIFGNQDSTAHDGAGILVRSASNFIGDGDPTHGNAVLYNDRGIVIENTSLSGALGAGIGNAVLANRIGELSANGFPTNGNLREGVLIANAPGNRLVGNVVIGNGTDATAPEWHRAGVRVTADPATPQGQAALANEAPNRLEGNFIGTDATRTQLFTGNHHGVWVETTRVVIGGTVPTAANVISANQRHGIVLSGRLTTTTAALVQNNLIGLDGSGALDFGNTLDGVLIDGASGNALTANTISGNNQGVVIQGASATKNALTGNRIGTDFSGTIDVGNAADGVWINGAPGNTLTANTISGNLRGVRVDGAAATGNVLRGNLIGTDPTGALPLGNDGPGVVIHASNTTIGGLDPGTGNAIKFNLGEGVLVQSGTGNAVLSNSIFGNGLLGIELLNGSNNGIQPPTFTGAINDKNRLIVQGAYQGAPSSTYRIQFFSSPSADPSGTGEGLNPLTTLTITTSPTGSASFTVDLGTPDLANPVITATATSQANDSSEFSLAANAAPGVQFAKAAVSVNNAAATLTLVVTRSADTGAASVNYATTGGDAVPGVDYLPTSGTLPFAAGQLTRTFTVSVLSNPASMANKTFSVVLSDPTNLSLGSPSTAMVTIKVAEVQFSAVRYDVNEQGPVALITVTRAGSLSAPATVNYDTTPITARPDIDYVPISGTLQFAANQASRTIEVPLIDNGALDGTRTFQVNLFGPTGAILGARAAAEVVIHDNELELSPPVVTALTPIVSGTRITGIRVDFSKPMDGDRSTQLFSYDNAVISIGKDGLFGTVDDVPVRLVSADYDPQTQSVVLTPVTPLQLNTFHQVNINRLIAAVVGPGVADTFGNLLDGNNDGRPGGAFQAYVAAGTNLLYRDADKDEVTLALGGGGQMIVTLGADREAQSVRFSGTNAASSTLTGAVKKRGDSRGTTAISQILGASSAQVKLTSTPFSVGNLVLPAPQTGKPTPKPRTPRPRHTPTPRPRHTPTPRPRPRPRRASVTTTTTERTTASHTSARSTTTVSALARRSPRSLFNRF